MNIRKRGCCPNCGHQLTSVVGVGSGATKKLFFEANGVKKHLDDWAEELNVTPQAINYYRFKYRKMPFQDIYDRLKKGKTAVVPDTQHPWRKKVKYD